jgi:hypothetical protein
MTSEAIFATGMPMVFRDEGHHARRAWVHFEDVNLSVLDRVLHVHQPADLQRDGERTGLFFELLDGFGIQ